ncbi:MAG: class A beta-lactamase [Thermoanaerobaculia bacterium]|nr:class A beta-lactamase [Thermoanaerobaculia bacterium]
MKQAADRHRGESRHRRLHLAKLAAALGLLVAVVDVDGALAGDDLDVLAAEIDRLSAAAEGSVGVAAIHLESGRELFVNGDEPFPMASTYKVPIAVQLLGRVDAGEISLSDRVELEPRDLHPGSGILSSLFDDPGVELSLRNLLELTLLISDNSATDLILRAAGGAEAVSERMVALGFPGIRVDRSTQMLIGDYYGIEGLDPARPLTLDEFRERAEALSEEERSAARSRFDADPRDAATPRDMGRLLAALWRGEVLEPESGKLLIDIMARSTTGEGRIRGLLTADAWVAHKTGTIGGTTNDVGIVALPNGAGHVVVVVLVKSSAAEIPARELAIAHISRAIHDYFLFRPTS